MSTVAGSIHTNRFRQIIAATGMVFVILVAIWLPNFRRAGSATISNALVTDFATRSESRLQESADSSAAAKGASIALDATAGRKIVRTSSLEMVVQNPAEASDKAAAIAERLGGYVMSARNGAQNATSASLVIRIPASRFNEARAEIRKLGLRVDNENVQAQDVTRQYVDQDATIRNLKAEEAQYLAILKQATSVKDMMAVGEKLSAVRNQIEQQQAEFEVLSQQVETVAITISMRTEAEAQAIASNWRPLYQVKQGLHDGLESIATYASFMMSILFYLPAALLWAVTIFGVVVGGWRLLRWSGNRLLGASTVNAAQK